MQRTISKGKGKTTNNDQNPTRSCVRWAHTEDAVLVCSLVDLVNMGGWKQDNGQFRSGYLFELEKMMKEKIVGCQMKAQPHIDSRVKILRGKYYAIAEMRGPKCSGFGWNDIDKCITCDDDVWENWVKSHPNATGLRNKPFPFYNELDYVYGKDRATGIAAANPADVVEEIDMDEQEHHGQPESSQPIFCELGSEQEESSPLASNPFTQSVHTTKSNMPTSSGNKRKRAESLEVMQEFSSHMNNLGNLMATAGEHIGRLANCFRHESEGVERRMAVNTELMKVEGLSQEEIIKVGRKIALDPMETDYFFSLPDDFRKTYVLSLLVPDNV